MSREFDRLQCIFEVNKRLGKTDAVCGWFWRESGGLSLWSGKYNGRLFCGLDVHRLQSNIYDTSLCCNQLSSHPAQEVLEE